MVDLTLDMPVAAAENGSDRRPVVIVFKSHLLLYSETFIREQAAHLRRYRPIFAGVRRMPGLELPADSVEVIGRGSFAGRLREYVYALTGFAPDFIRRVRRHRPVLVHAHFGPSAMVASHLCRALGLPLVVTFHGYDATASLDALRRMGLAERIYARRYESLARDGVRRIAVSKFIADRLAERGFPRESTLVHYIGVDTLSFSPDPSRRRDNLVLFVGRLSTKKGCEYLIRAMARVRTKHPTAELAIVGDGPLRGQLESLAAELGVRARFAGMQPPEVVKATMRRAKVLCVPSVTAANGDSEGLPIVILEAYASGVPVVGSAHAGIPEVIIDGKTGFITRERDVDGIAAGLDALLSSETLVEAMGKQARDLACRQFDIRQQTDALERIYDDARRPATVGA